jgi:hypothetical protein
MLSEFAEDDSEDASPDSNEILTESAGVDEEEGKMKVGLFIQMELV